MKDYVSVKINVPERAIVNIKMQSCVLIDFSKVKAKTGCNLNYIACEILDNLAVKAREPGTLKSFLQHGKYVTLYFTHDENIEPIPVKIYPYMTPKDVIKTYEIAYKAAVNIEDVRKKAEKIDSIEDLV